MAADEKLEVNKTLSPCTTEFAYVRCTFEDSRAVVFVDTPPFPDPYDVNPSEKNIANSLSEWIKEAWVLSSWILRRNDLPCHMSSPSVVLENVSKYLASSIFMISASTVWLNLSPTTKYSENSAGKSTQRVWPSCWLCARMWLPKYARKGRNFIKIIGGNWWV